MPEKNYRDINEIRSVETLADIFELTASLLDAMIYKWDDILFDEEARPVLKNAFDELVEMNYQEIYNQLRETELIEEDLRSEGLWRDQDQFELKIFTMNWSWRKFWKNPIVEILRSVLEFLNKILKSLKDALPLGFGVWIEIKDCAEALIKQSRDLNKIPLN